MKKRGRISLRILFGMFLFAVSITILITLFSSVLVWRHSFEMLSDQVSAVAKTASRYVDAERIKIYYETKQTDDYYDRSARLFSSMAENYQLESFYIFIPEEDRIVYIWDQGMAKNINALGDTDPYFTKEEKEVIQSQFTDQPKNNATCVTDDPKYGLLLSAYYPVLDANGQPTAMIGTDIKASEIVEMLLSLFRTNITVVSAVTLIMLAAYYFGINRFLIRPINKLHKAAGAMVHHLEDDPEHTKEFKVDVHTNDELEDLADAFTQMDLDLKEYIVRLKTVTSEKEKIRAELNVAAKIQKDMLPTKFPPFPEYHQFELYASMEPAREVGGDFYDFYLVDENHLALVIADVSDKGVPASLFMAISKKLIHQRAILGGETTSEILSDINEVLCEGNDASQFVTVWIAIIDVRDGTAVVTNAGHEHPVLRRKDGRFELVKYRHSMALGIIPGIPMEEHEFAMSPGDSIFVYTDGVPDAVNPKSEQFGTDRLLEALNTVKSDDPKEMIDTVSNAIRGFVKDAPPFDDITMLAFTYYGPEKKEKEL
ncbi:MAG: PP2C family protein-serine/threonine phosphatase [Solobacterium sp.]|nr:PP2C family protein-serine/threonine phosphatase [Solobacterium sp.]